MPTRDTPSEFAHEFRGREVLDAAVDGIDRLDPPLWAVDRGNYQHALRALQSVAEFSSSSASSGSGMAS